MTVEFHLMVCTNMLACLPLNLALRSSGGTPGPERNRFWGRKLAVAFQISLCMVVLSEAGLLYRTFRNLQTHDLGLRTSGLLVFGISPQSTVQTDADAIHLHTELLERLRALPGVDSATIMEVRLGSGGSNNDGVLVDGRNPMPSRPVAPMRTNLVGSDFLRTIGIPLRLGRDFNNSDMAASPRVAIVNQTFADRYLPGVNPLGHQIAFFEDKTQFTIVGVAANSQYTAVRETERPVAYFHFAQTRSILEMQYALHTSGDPRMLVPEAAKVVHQLDSNLPLEKPTAQRDQFEETISQERLTANLSVFFGALAAFLVAIGLYGTVSYSVSRRNMEIGLRMALGAQRQEVLWMVLRDSLQVAALGLAIGLPAAFIVARASRSLLYGLSPSDPLTIVFAVAGIVVVTVGAALFPARGAASVDPMCALRME